MIYDQSPFGNHLRVAPARRGSIDLEVNASVDPLMLGGKKVYSAYFQPVSDYPNATGGYEHATAVGVGCKSSFCFPWCPVSGSPCRSAATIGTPRFMD